MSVTRTIVSWGWCPTLIALLAMGGYIYEWPVEILATVLGVIWIVGLVVALVGVREKKLELASQRLRQLAGYFTRRFTGNSSLSTGLVLALTNLPLQVRLAGSQATGRLPPV